MIHKNRLKDSEKITCVIFCFNQTVLEYNFKNVFRTQFSKLINWVVSVESETDITCVSSFVKIGSGIGKLTGGEGVVQTLTHRETDSMVTS
jgi:hypothetical protein